MAKGKNKNIYQLMALLLSAGVREYEWKEEVLKEILKQKKLKIVKEFISYWWKGKNPETEQEKRLQHLVQGVENPYSYFAWEMNFYLILNFLVFIYITLSKLLKLYFKK